MAKKDKKKAVEKELKKAAKLTAAKAAKKAAKKAAAEKALKELIEAVEPVAAVEEPVAPEPAEVEAVVVEAPEEEKPVEKPALALAPAAEGEPWKTVSIKMPVSWVETIDKAAQAYGDEGVSRSEYIRMALEAFLAK